MHTYIHCKYVYCAVPVLKYFYISLSYFQSKENDYCFLISLFINLFNHLYRRKITCKV